MHLSILALGYGGLSGIEHGLRIVPVKKEC